MIRSFVALALPTKARDTLATIRDEAPGGRPVTRDNFHLTLAFLDDQPEAVLRELTLALATTAPPGPIHLNVTGLCLLGSRKLHVLAAEIRPDPPLVAMHDRVRRALRLAGLDLPRGRFRPHVTLIRIGGGMHPSEMAALQGFAAMPLPPLAFTAVALGLYASTLTHAGPVYDELARFELPGTPR